MEIPDYYSLKEDKDDHFIIHDTRDKSDLKVAKKPLHPAHQIKIMKMRGYADGGEVEKEKKSKFGSWGRMDDNHTTLDDTLKTVGLSPDEEALASQAASQAEMNKMGRSFQTGAPEVPVPVAMEQAPVPVAPAPQAQVMPQQQQQVPQPNPMAGMPTVQSLNNMQSQYEGALNRGAQGQVAQNRETVELYGQKLPAQEQAAKTFQDTMNNYRMMAEQMAQDISNTKIDPKAYWANKDSGSKAMAAIGILISGMSGRTSNMAMDVIQKNIDRDIDAQKANLGKKQTLLSDNFRQQGNLAAAESATRAQYESIFQGKLAQMAAKTNNPMVLAQAQQQIMDSRLRMMQYLQPVAQNQMVMQMREAIRNSNGYINEPPEQYIPVMVPEARQKDAFEKVEMMRGYAQTVSNVKKIYKEMKKIGSIAAATPFTDSKKQLEVLNARLEQTIRNGMKGQGAISDKDADAFTPFLTGTWDRPNQIDAAEKGMLGFLEGKVAGGSAGLRAYGIDPAKFRDFQVSDQNEDQRMMMWAQQMLRQDPSNKKARLVMEKLNGG